MHADAVFRFILKNLRVEEKAKDIVQDAFTRMWEKCDLVEFDKAKSYLFTTAYRRMIDIIRREKKQGNWSEVYENAHSVESTSSDLGEQLQMALDRLPEQQRSLVMLRDYEGYNYQEISEITDLSLAQVKVYIFRARKALKNYLVSIETLI